ncbi:pilus assembly protein PilY [Ectopseudomonas composti]
MNASPIFTRNLLTTLGFFLYFSGSLTASAAALNVSQKPLMLNETVAPNLIFTLDDSTSMNRAFVPDVAGSNEQQDRNDIRNTRRGKSAYFNSMHYDPKTVYLAPVSFNSSGVEVPLSSSFSKAFMDGFAPTKNSGNDWLDLRSNYRPAWNYNRSSNGHGDFSTNSNAGLNSILATHPSVDFSRTETLTSNNSQRIFTTPAGIKFTFNRGSSNTNFSCQVQLPGQTAQNITCTRSNNNYTANITTNGVPAYYYLYDETLGTCSPRSRDNDDCYKIIFVSETSGSAILNDGSILKDERANFSIWYSFYRNRALATLSAASIAFYNLSSSSRLTWQSLIHCTALNSSTNATSTCGVNQFRTYTSGHQKNFFNWLQNNTRFNDAKGTPLRSATQRAGEFLRTSDIAWHKEPGGTGNTTSNTYSCRPSYHIAMTDGMWTNTGEGTINPTNHDDKSFTLPDGVTTYTGKIPPYADTTSSTLADVAMHYWSTDLRPTLPNDLSPYIPFRNGNSQAQYWDPRNNPATWQHMVNFMMGLGLSESLNASGLPWEGSTFSGSGYEKLKSGTSSWPAASSGSMNNVYDLWHAAINSRGEFFSVDSPDDMVKAFKGILNRIADRTATAARPAVSASFVADNSDGTLQSNVYATQFSSEDWSGELSKTKLVAGQMTNLWRTSTANQGINHSTRKVVMAASGSDNKLKDFNWSNLGSLQDLLNVNPEDLVGNKDGRGQQRVSYILGDRSLEGDSGTSFRKRNSTTVIGDIINSSPVVVGTPAYLAYLADAIEQPDRDNYKGYAAFRQNNQKRYTNADTGESFGRKEMIYVGGNDGMLHGFNAATGVEEFAFIPTEVIKNLYRLTGKNYSGGEHHYFVDGTPVVRDVYLGDEEGWRTVLVGTLRAGGKALFALDITDPDAIKLLWEFNSTSDTDLGYTFAQPEIVRLHTGEWAVLQGNGYDSTNDRAAMLIINIKTGALIKKILVPEIAEGGVTLPNGLSSVRGADNNGDGLVDYAYAGDLQGNVWRFDLVKPSSSSVDEYEYTDDSGAKQISNDPFNRRLTDVKATTSTDFKLAYGGNPLFTARDTKTDSKRRQAITIQPSLVRHPTRNGYLVLVGTGKYFEHSDANVDTSRAMTLYGIWDRNTKRQATSSSTLRAEARERLHEQQFSEQKDNASFTNAEGEVTATRDIRLLSNSLPKWYKDPEPGQLVDTTKDENVNKWGWALDMAVSNKLTGEMVVNNMTASGSILFLSSLTPNQDPCQAGAETWLYAIDAYNGGQTRFNVLDLNADKVVNQYDQYGGKVVSGMRFPALGGFTLAPGNNIFGSDGAADPATVGDDPNSRGRQSWHIVPEEYQ